MSMITEGWSGENRAGYKRLMGHLIATSGDVYTFFAQWISEIASRQEHEIVQEQLSIARELGYLSDDEKTKELWSRWERAGAGTAETPEAAIETDLGASGQESKQGVDRA